MTGRLTHADSTVILQRMADFVTALERDEDDAETAYTFFAFVLMAEAFANSKKMPLTLEHAQQALRLAQRMVPIRAALIPSTTRWSPLTKVYDLLQSEAVKLARLYGATRPNFTLVRRELQQEFHTTFTQSVGARYETYKYKRTTKERSTITAFWDDKTRTAFAAFQAEKTLQALDQVIACLPHWTNRHHERWGARGTWREPSAQEVMRLFMAYMEMAEAYIPAVALLVMDVQAYTPVVERAPIALETEPKYAEQMHTLQEQIAAVVIPKELPRPEQTRLRKEKSQLQQALKTLQQAREAEIARRVTRETNVRRKFETLERLTRDYTEALRQKLGRLSLDVLTDIIWIYDYERGAPPAWGRAKRDARSFVRALARAREQEAATA